jgi:tetratricopeptide (TPR) repeat protein
MDGDEDREMELYTKAIEADPTFAPPYYNIGKTREDNGDIDSAREFYEKALEHNPHYIEAAEQLAGIMWAEGDRMEAVNRLWDNIQSDPLRVATYQNLLGAASELDDERLTGIVMQAFKENLPRAYVTAQRQDDSDA